MPERSKSLATNLSKRTNFSTTELNHILSKFHDLKVAEGLGLQIYHSLEEIPDAKQ